MDLDSFQTPLIPDDDLFRVASDCVQNGYRLTLAIVIDTWRSSPRQIGSMMLVREDKMIYGSVSGGCVEGAVIEASLKLMSHGGIERLDFGVSDAEAWDKVYEAEAIMRAEREAKRKPEVCFSGFNRKEREMLESIAIEKGFEPKGSVTSKLVYLIIK